MLNGYRNGQNRGETTGVSEIDKVGLGELKRLIYGLDTKMRVNLYF
jgi:hypothetical protein